MEWLEERAQPAGLVAAYSFDEGVGATVADASGSGNNGVIVSTTWSTSGKYGGALSFNGINGRVDITDSASLRLTTGMTLEAWVNPTAVNTAWRDVIYKGNDNYYLEATSSTGGRPAAGTIVSGSYAEAYGAAALPLNTWTHLATTYDGTALRMYVNGTLASTTPATGTIATSSNPLQIGGDSIYGQYFAGLIDEVRIYDRALSAAEIQADMNLPVGTPVVDTEPPLVALTGPADGAIVSGTVTVSAAASDNVSVAGVQFLLNGANLGAEDTTAPYSLSWDTSTASSGTHTLTARARDAAGNITTSISQSVTVVPQLIITSPVNNSSIGSTTVDVTYTIAGDVTGIDHAHFVLDGGPELPDDTLDGSFQLTNVTPGAHTLSGFLVHSATQESGSAVSFTVVLPETIPPTVTLTAPADGATVNGTLQVTADAFDNVAVAGVQFFLDSAPLGAEDTVAPYSVTWNTATVSNGEYVLTARARDTSGNTATSDSVTVTVNNLAPTGLVLALGFDEGLGGTVGDTSGNGNSGTIGNATWTTAGRFGNALSFNGSNALVTVADDPSLDLTTAMTLEAWVNPSNVSNGWRDVIYKGVNDIFYLEATSHLGPPAVGGTFSDPLFGTTRLTANTWSHLAATYDGAALRLYVNGVEVASRPQTNLIETSDAAVTIGGDLLYGQYFAGLIDEVRIYDRALSAAEIQADMNIAVGTPASDTIPPQVSVNSPTINAQVADIVTVMADASDNVGVVEVQFYVDGTAVGVADAEAPYGVDWDTRTVTNGSHTLTAQARDAAGNIEISSAIVVNVSNTNFFQNEILATGFDLPTSIEFLPDGRMLVAELTGAIRLLQAPYVQPDATPLLDLDLNIGGYAGLQQGIMDVALDPDFANNHFYYVFYTNDSPNRDRLSRFTANATLDATVPGSEVILYEDPQTADTEHHGGAMSFGNDGKLYFTTGDHFNAALSQDLSSPRGKIHRINPDGTVPTDNPFYDGAGPNWDSIWAYGLRNPFRAYYDAPTGRLFVADVGGNNSATAVEEVNLGAAGANYGWPNVEGPTNNPTYTNPLYSYPHNNRDASVTGGFVYHGTQFPAFYRGNYFFADYAQNWIRRLTFDANGNVSGVFNFEPIDGSLDGPYGDIVYLTEGPDGALYYVDLGYSDVGGTFGVSKIRRIRYVESNQAPVAVASADPTEGARPLTVNFSSSGSIDPEGLPLTYEWSFGDSTTSTEANPVHVYTQAGQYTVRLSVSDGVTTTLAPPITISVGSKPVATILTPTNNVTFRAGDVISFSGAASDAEDGTLPPSNFTWAIDFLHEGHVHPGSLQSGVTSGTFTIPTFGHDYSGDTRYRILLTVTDSDGLQATQTIMLYPAKVNLTFDSLPTGLTLTLDGISRTTPFAHDTLIGFTHTIGAPAQLSGGASYEFVSWSDGGAQSHSIVVPASDQSFLATFEAAQISGMVAAYSFDEGVGGTVGDASGNLNSGTISNATWSTAGRFGSALSFNGTDAMVTVGDANSLDLTMAMTLEAWVRPSAINSWETVILKERSGGLAYALYGGSPGGGPPAGYITRTGTSGDIGAGGTGALALNAWSHLAATYDGATIRLYVNGSLTSSQAAAGSIMTSSDPLRIGGNALWGEYFDGLIDEVRIYDRVLSVSEIQTDMNTPIGVGTPAGFQGAAGSSGMVSMLSVEDDQPQFDVQAVPRQSPSDGVRLPPSTKPTKSVVTVLRSWRSAASIDANLVSVLASERRRSLDGSADFTKTWYIGRGIDEALRRQTQRAENEVLASFADELDAAWAEFGVDKEAFVSRLVPRL